MVKWSEVPCTVVQPVHRSSVLKCGYFTDKQSIHNSSSYQMFRRELNHLRCTREMSGRRVSRLPSLKAPSPNTHPSPSSPVPSSTGSDDSKEPSRLFKRQTRSRRTSLSSNENGSLNRDAHLSDFAFVEQLEDFRRQLLDLRKDKKKQEDEIIKYKLLCKEKHQNIQELHNKLEAEKANTYDLREQLTRDLTLQLNNQHANDKKKLTFDISILKNEKRKMDSEIRLLETTNKGLFEEIRQIRSSYDTKMEKLMKDFHIEIYKESGEKRRLEKKLADTSDKLSKEEYLSKQSELEKERAEEEAKDARQRRTSTFGFETSTLDRQNKKISELEETVRKLESLKTIAESQNFDLMRKLKEAEKSKSNTLRRNKQVPDNDKSVKLSPGTERKRLNKVSGKDKIEAADKKLNNRDGRASKKDLESYLKLANKERNVLERKIALLEKTRQQTGDEKFDNEIAALRQQHKELLNNITAKDLLLDELEGDDKKRNKTSSPSSGIPGPMTSGLAPPSKQRKAPKSPRSARRGSRSPSPMMKHIGEEEEEEEDERRSGPGSLKKPGLRRRDSFKKEKKKSSREETPDGSRKKSSREEDPNVVKIDRSNYSTSEMQTIGVEQKDAEIQVEFYDEEEDSMYDNFGFQEQFSFQEPAADTSTGDCLPDLKLGSLHSNDKVMEEYEEKISALQRYREKDMEKIQGLCEKIEHYKQEVAALNRKVGSYYNELEANNSKLNTSVAEIDKLNDEIKNLQQLNSSLYDHNDDMDNGDIEKQLADTRKDLEQMTSEMREKQITIMKLHQELHEASEEVMDKSACVRQLEALVENLKHDKEIMREEQMNFETTTEEVLDQLRTHKVRNNQLEELVKSLEGVLESQKSDLNRANEEKVKLQTDAERLEVETEDLTARMAARDMELETALSENPTSEGAQETLNLLQEVRQKDNALKRLQKKHDETLLALKKEVEKQVVNLQSKISRRDDDLANLKSSFNQERTDFMSQIHDLNNETSSLRDTISDKEREVEEIYGSVAAQDSKVESVQLNKRLAELANENMMLRDEIGNYRKLINDKRPTGLMAELGQRIQTQRPSYTGPIHAPSLTVSDEHSLLEEFEEEDEDEDIGELSVALVLYSYDPTTMSPNDYPEDELTLTSGDFIYIFGDPDHDGFYTAELMSGERGLVPSNFIQTVELNEKKTQQMRRISQTQRLSLAPIMSAIPINTANTDIPIPEDLDCEAIGTKTLELRWELPDTGAIVPILGFQIFVNSQEFKRTNTGECRTVLNDLPPGRPLYVSLKTVSSLGEGKESKPFVYGREAIKAPQSLDVTNVTSSSAVLTFVGQPHYHHGAFINGELATVLQPGNFVHMLKKLESDTEYEVRIVTLPSDDVGVISKKTFSCSQSTNFITEIEGTWEPLSPPPSLDSAPPTPDDLQLNILDRDTIQLSWSAVQDATSYQMYINNVLDRTTELDLRQNILLSDLPEKEDEQCFYVVAVNGQGGRSEPSETISFFKSELFSQLASFFTDSSGPVGLGGPSPPPSDVESEVGLPANLPDEIRSRLLYRITSPCEGFQVEQIICVEPDHHNNEDHLTRVDGKVVHVSVSCAVQVPITRRVVALYDYYPSAMSPNDDSEEELSFVAGDVILVYDQESEGFLKGVLDNKSGLVPSNFVIDLEAVLTLRNSIDETKDSTLPKVISREIPANLMTVNSS